MHRGPGGRVHARNGMAYVARRSTPASGRRVRAAALVLLQRPQQPRRGSREVPGGAAALGADHARRVRRGDPRSWPCASTPRRGQHADGAAAREHIVRVAVQALAAVLGGCQSLHTNSMDEALASRRSAPCASRSGPSRSSPTSRASPTSSIPRGRVCDRAIDGRDRGGRPRLHPEDRGARWAVLAIPFMQREIQDAAVPVPAGGRGQGAHRRGCQRVRHGRVAAHQPLPGRPGRRDALAEKLVRVRAKRDRGEAESALDALETAARGSQNLVACIVRAVERTSRSARSATGFAASSGSTRRRDVLTRPHARVLGALVALGLLVHEGPASAGLADRVGATFVLMAEDFVRAFQPVEGLVVGVEGDALYLDLGESRGAQTGQELTIFRRGEEFYHTVTGKPLGHYEETLGWAQIRRVQARFSEAVYVPLEGKPRRRRTTACASRGAHQDRDHTRARPHPVESGPASRALSARDRARALEAVPGGGPARRRRGFCAWWGARRGGARPAEPGDAAGEDARGYRLVVPVVLERRGVTYLDTTWISAVTGTALFSRRQPLVPRRRPRSSASRGSRPSRTDAQGEPQHVAGPQGEPQPQARRVESVTGPPPREANEYAGRAAARRGAGAPAVRGERI